MRLFMRRRWRVPSGKIAGLTRIAMPGCSMTAGYGVSFDQTLPAQLEGLLNAGPGDQLFQVITCGVNNATAWTSLSGLMHRPVFYDVLVPELSVTTATMVHHTLNKRCTTMPAVPGRDGTLTHDLVRKHLRQAAEHFAANGVPLALLFYSHRDNLVSREMQRHLQRSCDDAGLPPIHTLDVFAAPAGGHVTLDVSGADLHPSEQSHGIAAAHIAAELVKVKVLSQQRPPSTVQLAPRRIASIMAAMQRQGEPLDVILPWAQSALDAKRAQAARAADWRVRDTFGREAGRLAATLARSRQAWRQACRAASYAGLAGTPDSIVDHRLRKIMDDLLRAEELAITVGTPQATLGQSQPQPSLADDAASLAAKLACAERGLAEAEVDPALSLVRPLVAGYRAAAATVTALANDYAAMATAIGRARNSLLVSVVPGTEATECLNRAEVQIRDSLQDLDSFMLGAESIDTLVTHFTLRWQTAPRMTAQRFDVTIQVQSLVPQRPILRHHATLIEDGTEQTIAFRLPMLFTGQLSLDVGGRDVADRMAGLQQIAIHSHPSTVTVVNLDAALRHPGGTAVFPVFHVR